MAQAFIQAANSGTGSTATTKAATLGVAQTVGNFLIAVVTWGNSSGTTVAATAGVADTRTSLWTPGAITKSNSSGAYAIQQQIFTAKNITAGANTATVTYSGSSDFCSINLHEYSGVDTIDQAVQNFAVGDSSTTTLSITSGPMTTTHANEIIFMATLPFDGSFGATSGWTQRSVFWAVMTQDLIVTTIQTGLNPVSQASNGHSGWVSQSISLYQSGGGTLQQGQSTIAGTRTITAGGQISRRGQDAIGGKITTVPTARMNANARTTI